MYDQYSDMTKSSSSIVHAIYISYIKMFWY